MKKSNSQLVKEVEQHISHFNHHECQYFGRILYVLYHSTDKKSEAEKLAKRIRKLGYNARVSPVTGVVSRQFYWVFVAHSAKQEAEINREYSTDHALGHGMNR